MARPSDEENGHSRLIRVPAGSVLLEGSLSLPRRPAGMVLFAHGSGSSRHSPRNRAVARTLEAGSLGTLLLDLLTAQEESIDSVTGELRFDVDLLADRLVNVMDWLTENPETCELPLGMFGASTGAAAALAAAARRPQAVRAVVSRGGRPDLAGPALSRVLAPTLLIVGGRDIPVIALNREAQSRLRAEAVLEIVPGASHLFEEPGALERVAALARSWFLRHLIRPALPLDRPRRRPAPEESDGEA
jgi:putative phosphoribosyl transferase